MIVSCRKLRLSLYVITIAFVFYGCTTPSILATKSIREGDLLNNQNKYNEAIAHYEEYLRISPQLGVYRNSSMEADVCRKLAHAYATQGKYKDSKKYLSLALKADSTGVFNEVAVAEDYQLLGLVTAYSGDVHQALRYLSRSLRITERMDKSVRDEKRSSLAGTHLALAQVQLTLGNYNLAEQHASTAMALYNKLTDEAAGVIECELILGEVLRDQGELERAEKWLVASKSLASEQRLNTGRQLQAISEIYILQGRIEEAIRYKMLALDEARKTNIKPQIIISLSRLGDSYSQLGDEKKAQDYYKEALKLQSETDVGTNAGLQGLKLDHNQGTLNNYLKSGSSLGKGLLLLRIGLTLEGHNADSAISVLRDARENLLKGENKEAVAKVSLALARVLIKSGNDEEATKLLTEANKLTIQPDLKWQISFQSGLIRERNKSYDSARHYYEQSIEIIDGIRANLSVDEFKTVFANNKVEVYDRIILLLLRNKDRWKDMSSSQAVERAFAFNEQARSRTFLDMLGNKKIEARQTSDTVDLHTEQLLRLKIQRLIREIDDAGNSNEAKQRYSDDLKATQEEHENLIRKIKLYNSAYSTMMTVAPPELESIQSALTMGTAIVEYWVSNEALVIFSIDREHVSSEIVEISQVDLQRYVTGARNGIAYQDESSTDQTLRKLYDVLLKPVHGRMSAFKNLVIIPHRSLHFLPFQTLLFQQKYLIETYAISYAPSASIFYYCTKRKVEPGHSFLGMALGNSSVGTHSALPGTDVEVNQLVRLYPESTKRSNADFLETELKSQAAGFNYVHIATHGVFNKYQPLYSYLAMKESEADDGRLTVDEIFGLRIKSHFVTLSACETGMGALDEGDELVGLSRAFIYAGTPGVVVSLWKVDDATTAWLMTRFHQYCRTGLEPAQALTYAQRDLLQKNVSQSPFGSSAKQVDRGVEESVLSKTKAQLRSPYYWAPFILIGHGFGR